VIAVPVLAAARSRIPNPRGTKVFSPVMRGSSQLQAAIISYIDITSYYCCHCVQNSLSIENGVARSSRNAGGRK
jgi:hypothetical protein